MPRNQRLAAEIFEFPKAPSRPVKHFTAVGALVETMKAVAHMPNLLVLRDNAQVALQTLTAV